MAHGVYFNFYFSGQILHIMLGPQKTKQQIFVKCWCSTLYRPNVFPITKEQDNRMHTRCWRNCIGCQWSSTSPTSWPYWRSRYVSTSVSQSVHHSTQWHSFTAVISCSISRRAVQTHWHRQTIFQLCCACNLELSASCCHQLGHLSVFKSVNILGSSLLQCCL